MAITKQDVFRVASEIDAEGGKPTVVECRKRLGSGSFTTITAALKEWKEQPEAVEVIPVEGVPAEVIERLTQAAADVYALVLRRTGEAFEPVKAEWEAERASLFESVDSARAFAEQVSGDCELLRSELRALEYGRTELERKAARAEGAGDALRSELDAARLELARERMRADGLAQEMLTLRVQVQAQQAALDACVDQAHGKRAPVRRRATPQQPATPGAESGVQ